MTSGRELLTNEEMARADRLAVAAGIAYLTLMENAGRAVAEEAARMVPAGARIAVICGPGNNGGDGFVAARYLRDWGFRVRVGCLVPVAALTGDAAAMARRFAGPVEDLAAPGAPPPAVGGTASAPPDLLASCDLVVDALFGAGLNRDLTGAAAGLVAAIAAVRDAGAGPTPRASPPRVRVLAIDVPSGINGTTGAAHGGAVTADRTVTFFRRKPGHLLLPGRRHCGEVVVRDIAIPAAVLADIRPLAEAVGAPGVEMLLGWSRAGSAHKYTRGHAVVVSGPAHATGAARLGARGALRVGAGLVTLAVPHAAANVAAASLTAVMLHPFAPPNGLADVLADRRRNAVLIGPGCGVGAATRTMVRLVLATGVAAVLDADALTSFCEEGSSVEELAAQIREGGVAGAPWRLPGRPIPASVVLTPHEGEFQRLFGAIVGGASKLERAREAARASGAVVVLKGPDTVIAAPDGRAAINENAPPWLATAGSGDVLAGFVTGLLAQGLPAFEAASAAVWLHGACGAAVGPGLIAEDIPEALPRVLADLARPGKAGGP